MKKCFILFLLVSANCLGIDGQLDSSFGNNGIVVTSVGSTGIQGAALTAVAIQTDGKIVVAGYANPSGNIEFAVARYNANGTLDTSFNPLGIIPGIVFTNINGVEDQINDVRIQPDGKIVVVGFTLIGSTPKIAVARYNQDGSLDTGFNGTGIAVTDFGGGAIGEALTLQSDGKIVIAGTSVPVGQQLIARFYPDGTLDNGSQGGSGFGVSGKVTSAIFGSNGVVSSIAATHTQQLLIGGTIGSTPNRNFALARFNADGSLDTQFGVAGLAQTTLTTDAHSTDMRVQADHKIVIAGVAGSDFVVARFYADGAIDNGLEGGSGFGPSSNGIVTTDLGNNDQINGVVIPQDGKIVVVGASTNTNGQFAIARYTHQGILDTSSFNPPIGFTLTTFPDIALGLAGAIQADGNVVVVGVDGTGSPSNLANVNFALARYQAQPKLINARILFPLDGTTLSTNTISISGIAQNPSNIIVYVDDQFFGRAAAKGFTNSWSLNALTPVANGAHVLTAVAEYSSGNENSVSQSVRVTIES